ncbi:hypothetical protein Barb6_02251 [Bacteroidales bacterium Barb6]|nr:hypothetical protein Barb6_02251 [Bacteroidales bacterium Barb6]
MKAVKIFDGCTIQPAVALILTLAGITLLFCGFWVSPAGKIDSGVLVAFGEVSTFAGALFGVDYSYKMKNKKGKTGELRN